MANFQYKHYALLLLTFVGTFNYLDRGVLALAMEPIKEEFHLNDGELGLMSGFAFALFYAVAGLPIARWADRGNRNHVVTVTTALWSVMLVLCGSVMSFWQLLLARVGVAVGEAGCVPPAHSLISDYFDRAERPQAMAIYWLCGPISTLLSFAGGGWLIEHLGWRNTFWVIGLPGALLALVIKLTLQEPRVKKKNFNTVVDKVQPSVKTVLGVLWMGRALRHITMTWCVLMFVSYGAVVWLPAFFIRSYGVDTSVLGVWMGLSIGGGGILFTYLSGYLAARYAPRKEMVQMKCIAILIMLSAILHFLYCLSGNKYTSLILMSVVMGGTTIMCIPPLFAAIQSLVEERMRAVTLAIIFLLSNLIGMGLGPLAVGFVSDQLAPSFGQESLRYALLLFSPGFLWGAFHAWKAANTIENDMLAVEKKDSAIQIQEASAESGTPPHIMLENQSA